MLKEGNERHSYSWEQTINNSTSRNVTSVVLPWSRDGVQLPNYRQLILDNKDATTSLIAKRASIVSFAQGSMTGVYRFNKSPVRNTSFGMNYPEIRDPLTWVSALQVNAAKAQARSYAFDKINRLQDPFSLGIFGGELRETVKLLANPLKSSINLTKDLAKAISKSGGFKTQAAYKAAKRTKGAGHVESVLKSMSDMWLEYRFGILPLLMDMDAILELAADKSLEELHIKNRTYGKSESSTSQVLTGSGIGTSCIGTKENTWIYRAECFIHFGVLYDRLNRHEEFSGRLLQSFDSFEELTLTAWELLPFSFLVDYFVNVGDVLSAALSTSSVLSYSSESVVRTVIGQTSVSNIASASSGSDTVDNIIVNSLPHITVQNRHVQRIGGVLAIPPITFTLPGSNVRYMNIAALVASLNLRRS